jgi:serine/threonine protein kinase
MVIWYTAPRSKPVITLTQDQAQTMQGSGDEKKELVKSPPVGDQPTTPVGTPVPSPGAAGLGRADTRLRALEQRYEILGEAGRGGMGIVYRARDRETGELVALKVLKPEIAADAAIVERFKNELRLARKITHKNVCRIHEFNRAADGSAYISMEFVDGDSLRHILKRFGAMGLRTGIRIAQQICAGLREAHAQGVVHRDLKPENVMLDREGNVKVMDFGIARSVEAGTTTTGMMGTPAYMAPEQAQGKAVDNRADIYALGLILYELFTGATAFTGETPVAVALKQIHETPPAPREVEPALPAHIEKAILKSLEKNPAKRFQSVGELEAALTKEPEAKPAVPEAEGAEISLPVHLATWQRSDWLLLASGVLGAAVFLLLFYRFHPASASVITNDAEQQRQITADGLKKLQWDVEVGRPLLGFDSERYYWLASLAGSRVARDRLSHSEIIGTWSGSLRVSEGEGKSVHGNYRTDFSGRLCSLELWTPAAAAPIIRSGPVPDEAPMARMKEIAQTAAQTLFGVDLSAIQPSARAYWVPLRRCWLGMFQWTLPQPPRGPVETIDAFVEGSRLKLLSRGIGFESPAEQSFDWGAYSPPLRYFASGAGLLMVWFTLILFFARRIYREPRSRESLRLALAIGLGGAVAISPALPRNIGGPGEAAITSAVVWGVLTFSVVTLLSYAILNTVLYYLRRRFPVQAANYLQLFREHVFARTAGLEMLRGVFAGAAFGGVWMALVSLAGVWGKALAGMIFWLEPYGDIARVPIMSAFQPRVLPVLLIGEVLLIAWLLVALPLSLLSRATTRWRVLLAALSALWMALGFSLAGAMVFPTWPYLIFVVLQAIFCGVVFLRYGLLATLSAVFTIEVGLLAFPLLEIFQNIDPLPYAIPVVLWFMLSMAAAGLYLRPQLVGAYRRVAAVFE